MAAENALRARTAFRTAILRPGLLSDEPGTGRVTPAERNAAGSISRPGIAAALLALLDEPRLGRRTVEVIGADIPIADAAASLAAR
ncbi:hypothetical protein ACFWBB_03705 [Streptomyces sp. NPDC060000]|uniref:hypothetical protein n=1 Tax=Streptomyces sp. NPDC060000 TaxID=3347031 RepID=UPI0036A1544D